MTPRRWYASRAAAERGWGLRSPKGERTAKTFGAGARVLLMLGVCRPYPQALHATLHVVDVTGRSPAHVDRLARDWISAGVSPTRDGGRGVGSSPPCSCRPWLVRRWSYALGSYQEERHDLDCARIRFDRAEARARRVVAR